MSDERDPLLDVVEDAKQDVKKPTIQPSQKPYQTKPISNEEAEALDAELAKENDDTTRALDLLFWERDRQRVMGTDGLETETEKLIGVATRYLSNVVSILRGRKEGVVLDELVKGTAVLVDAIERENDG